MIKNSCGWNISELNIKRDKKVMVMSTFACGGGSSLGYKLVGCDVVAANDIDPQMARHYKKNINPKHYFLCPINDLVNQVLPPELFELDILDGSPPCSTFSMAGSREKSWGKNKHFREGQAKQVLSDLFFDYLSLVDYLRPKVAIAENVKGMLIGNAKGYTKLIIQRFKAIGYRPQLFLLDAADCGVPQHRERVFFCAVRDDISDRKLNFNVSVKKHISAGEAFSDICDLTADEKINNAPAKNDIKWWPVTKQGNDYGSAVKKITGREKLWSHKKIHRDRPSNSLTAADTFTHWNECRRLTFREWKRLGSFPDDYWSESEKIGKYMVGMSVPPKLMAFVADAVCEQWLDSFIEK